MKPIRALFVTYGIAATTSSVPAMMGVAKRVLRLAAQLSPSSIEPHLLHFGAEPADDPLWNRVSPHFHRPRLGFGSFRGQMLRCCLTLQPEVIVLGEGPVSGIMQTVFETALKQNIPAVCIDNYYDPEQPQRLEHSWPEMDLWFLLGLPEKLRYGRISKKVFLGPPLLPRTRSTTTGGPQVAILGYDIRVVELGMQLVARLPANVTATVMLSRDVGRMFHPPGSARGRVTYVRLPNEYLLSHCVRSSQFVVCKSGFQQMAEALALGTPVVAYSSPGGVPESLLWNFLKPFVCYFPSGTRDWSRLLSAASVWLGGRPAMPWQKQMQEISNPARYSAEVLLTALHRVCRGRYRERSANGRW